MTRTGMTVYVRRFSAWAAGLNSAEAWREWAQGKRKIAPNEESPALDLAGSQWLSLNQKEFALFKRRLSRISQMTIQALHGIMPLGERTKMVFVSFRGEIHRQLSINRMLIEEGDISPASFSQSVFNTPPALASIAFSLRGGYTAVYPGDNNFQTGFLAAAAPLFAASSGETALVYADESCPAEYGALSSEPASPLEAMAFAALLSAAGPGIPVPADQESLGSPAEFLKYLWIRGSGLC